MTHVKVMVPMKPTINDELRRKCYAAIHRMLAANPSLRLSVWVDDRPMPAQEGDSRPWSRVARCRNRMLEECPGHDVNLFLWIDADVVEYPADLPTRLLAANPFGVTAPMIFVEDSLTFYDWAAFIMEGQSHIEPTNRWQVAGRNLSQWAPYWPEPKGATVVPMDCVGTVTMVPSVVYNDGARYEDHPAFTDHFPICKRAKELGLPVVVDRSTVAYHAELPRYGEPWH